MLIAVGQISVDTRNNEAIPAEPTVAYSIVVFIVFVRSSRMKIVSLMKRISGFCSFKVGIICVLRQRTARASHDITQDGEIVQDRILPPMTGFD
jgi:hypothetical protein